MARRYHGDGGYAYYTCGYGPRSGAYSSQAVSMVAGEAERACEAGAQWTREDLTAYCDDEACDGACCFCDPDIVVGMETTLSAKDLFSPRELRDHRRALLAGDVVWLEV